MFQQITVHTTIHAALAIVWEAFTDPQHITGWNFASPDWHCPSAQNDLRIGGSFNYRMEDIQQTMGFDFVGTYTDLIPHQLISYQLPDNRRVTVSFTHQSNSTIVSETFDAETIHPLEMQQAGWQSILNQFKFYTESLVTS